MYCHLNSKEFEYIVSENIPSSPIKITFKSDNKIQIIKKLGILQPSLNNSKVATAIVIIVFDKETSLVTFNYNLFPSSSILNNYGFILVD